MPSERMTIARLAKELRGLSDRVETGFAQVDARFAQVDARFAQVDARFDQVDARFDQVDARFDQVDARFAQVDTRLAQVDTRLAQVDTRFDRVDARLAQLDDRFDQQRREIRNDLEEFTRNIKNAFKISLEGMEAKLDAALDDTREQKRRLDLFEHTNAEEHRLMQAQIQDCDAKLQSRRSRRRPS